MLFTGNAVITRGNAADEEQAKKARGTLAGDLLWFQVDGKAFITQDKDVMDRLQVADSGIPQAELVILQLQRQTDQRLALVQAQVQASQAQVEASIEQLERSLRRIPGGDGGGAEPKDLEAIRLKTNELQAANAQMEAMLAKREVELRRMESDIAARNSELMALREVDILRGAVLEGKAQVVPSP